MLAAHAAGIAALASKQATGGPGMCTGALHLIMAYVAGRWANIDNDEFAYMLAAAELRLCSLPPDDQ